MRSTAPIEHPSQGSAYFSDPDVPKLLHIPRTGGHARAASLRGAAMKGMVALCPHNTRASACAGPVICFLRDPVTRFLSAARRLKMEPEALLEIRAGDMDNLPPAPALLLRPQTWWLDRDLVQTYQMEALDDVWPLLMIEYDLPNNPLPARGEADRNESPGGLPETTLDVMSRIEESYAADMDAWAEAATY